MKSSTQQFLTSLNLFHVIIHIAIKGNTLDSISIGWRTQFHDILSNSCIIKFPNWQRQYMYNIRIRLSQILGYNLCYPFTISWIKLFCICLIFLSYRKKEINLSIVYHILKTSLSQEKDFYKCIKFLLTIRSSLNYIPPL